jgi:hypothetical protein
MAIRTYCVGGVISEIQKTGLSTGRGIEVVSIWRKNAVPDRVKLP